MSKNMFLLISNALSFVVFCFNVLIGMYMCIKTLENGEFDEVSAGLLLVLGFISGGCWSMILKSKMYEWIEIDDEKVIE